MKLIGLWLLILLAVLVPATAVIATSIVFPTVAADQAQAEGHGLAAQAESAEQHAAAPGYHTRVVKAKMSNQKAGVDHDPAEHCHDATPCGHCASCGSCSSIAAVTDPGAAAHSLAMLALSEPGGPPAEFLQSGQERPPRAS